MSQSSGHISMIMRAGLGLAMLAIVLALPSIVLAQANPFGGDTLTPSAGGSSAGDPGTTLYGVEVAIDRAAVNVRSGPGTQFRVLNTFAKGRTGKIIDEKNGWYQIDFGNGTKGWVRGDLTSTSPVSPTLPAADAKAKAGLEASFKRWDKHLGSTLLDFNRFPITWRLRRGMNALSEGDFAKAYELAQDSSGNPLEAKYLMAKSLFGLGRYQEARELMLGIEKKLEDAAFLQVIDGLAQPYIDEPVVFKFGGFDHITTYRMKKARDARIGLNSTEYYKRFVDIDTWKWRSNSAYQEFQKIAGVDCSGFVQLIQKEAFKEAGVTYPIQGRTSTLGLRSKNVSAPINPGHKPPPPPDIRPGDMILLDYGHNRYGHSMIYRGTDAQGNIRVLAMGDTAQEQILSPDKFEFFKGAYRMKGLDKVRAALTA